MFTISCYGKETQYEDDQRQEKMAEFMEAMLVCEGHESERYKQIYLDLKCGKEYCTDENA